MDALTFLKEQKRMCESCKNCVECPIGGLRCSDLTACDEDLKKKAITVEQWAKDHPVKTRMSEFLKQYPNAPLNDSGVPLAAPCYFENEYHNMACKGDCSECKRKYWLEEIE